MKVTSYFPEIFVRDIDKAAESYVNDLGFEIRHKHVNGDTKYYILKNAYGDRVALTSFPDESAAEGIYAMRINVDDITAGVEYFLVRGYKNPGSVDRGGAPDIHGKAKYEELVSPEGIRVRVIEHIKDED